VITERLFLEPRSDSSMASWKPLFGIFIFKSALVSFESTSRAQKNCQRCSLYMEEGVQLRPHSP